MGLHLISVDSIDEAFGVASGAVDRRRKAQRAPMKKRSNESRGSATEKGERSVVLVGPRVGSEVEFLRRFAFRRQAPHMTIVLVIPWSTTFTHRIVAFSAAGCDAVVHIGEVDGSLGPGQKSSRACCTRCPWVS
jgi:hypothetical protein